jgi:hypothetical protein
VLCKANQTNGNMTANNAKPKEKFLHLRVFSTTTGITSPIKSSSDHELADNINGRPEKKHTRCKENGRTGA